MRISSVCLCCRAHHATHERLILVRHDISGLIDDSCSTYGTARLHIYGITCYAYQSSCRSSLHVDICDNRLFIIENCRTDAVSSIYSTTICVQVKHDIVSPCLARLVKPKNHKPLRCRIDIPIESYPIQNSQ